MCSYLLKIEDEGSQAMTQALIQVWNKGLNNSGQMRLTAKAYATKRECSASKKQFTILC